MVRGRNGREKKRWGEEEETVGRIDGQKSVSETREERESRHMVLPFSFCKPGVYSLRHAYLTL